ncbi:hypothetical protein like AT1G14180 [Hibiscus trionum]|uniref:Uncharacterized protein n=1 Tax=Hibiscus trionum TaxID=183268 RepID=A0A9W7IY49_HIBTR|nr:hypothetical protein like AT1G14180 [Hibiscus trionum]
MAPEEPYWRTNTSFSPPPSRWDFHLQPDGLSYGSYDENQLYESSTSPNSKESRGWTPPVIQEISLDEYETAARRDLVGGQLPFTSIVEGNSTNADSGVSTSSYSGSSESEPMVKQCSSSQRNISSRYCFMSKPIPIETPTTEALDSAVVGLSDDTATPQRDAHRWSSSSSSNDIADISEPFESLIFSQSCTPSSGFECGLCERYLSQRSPWSARRINRIFSRFRSSISRLRPFSEDGPSRWSCAQVGDCVQGALQPPPRGTMLLLNQSRMKKNLFVKVNSSKEFPGKLRKSGSSSLQLFSGKSIAGPSMKS